MRGLVRKYLVFGFVMLLFGTTGMRTAEAVQFQGCASANYIHFPQGLYFIPSGQNIELGSIYSLCTPVGMSATPIKFVWTGTTTASSCLSVLNSVTPGTGIMNWSDNTTSNITLESVVTIGAVGITPAVATFRVNSGHGTGGSFTVAAAFLPSTNNVANCLLGNPIYYVSGFSEAAFIDLNL
ncbi:MULTISPECIES: hypothetical protein [unclassified Pseudoxanthomonas]|uniref:hypothetical protein n=1 Tax=unclassified Pseudoxanthomonas TaxID=2645906 RepID=UPI003076ADAB